ncbi:MAG: PEP-CTERM sorting domain-containing protein [Burkholderiales bacterium]|nr:MAG: PEP-CTERM sorting domain-containing protein [Burkholderiales bacterium]
MQRKLTPAALASLALVGLFHGSVQAAPVTSKQTTLGSLASPASAVPFGNSFTVASGVVSSVGGNSFSPADTFYDTYTFTVPASGLSSFVASLDLGTLLSITNLQSRLYAGTPQAAGTAMAGNPALINAWSTAQSNPSTVANGSGPFNMMDVPSLAAGTYTLEVRGQVVGTAGGAYAGLINVAQVPEPTTYLMLGLGLAVMALKIRRKTS